jgi:hypothetical protein
MTHAPTKAEQEYIAAAAIASDRGADEFALTLAEVEMSPRAAAAELVRLRALRIACQAKAHRLPDAVKKALAAARAPGITDLIDNQPELQP